MATNIVKRGDKEEILLHRIEMICEDCKVGTYKTTFQNDERLWHLHKCTICGSIKYFNQHYPQIISTEL